jgi:hypothetical protein
MFDWGIYNTNRHLESSAILKTNAPQSLKARAGLAAARFGQCGVIVVRVFRARISRTTPSLQPHSRPRLIFCQPPQQRVLAASDLMATPILNLL